MRIIQLLSHFSINTVQALYSQVLLEAMLRCQPEGIHNKSQFQIFIHHGVLLA